MQELFAGFDIQKNFSLFYSSLKSKREQAVRPEGGLQQKLRSVFFVGLYLANLTLLYNCTQTNFQQQIVVHFRQFSIIQLPGCAYLKFEQKFAVLRLLDTTLLLQEPFLVLITLQFFNVFDGGLEDGAFILADVSYDIIIPRGDQIKVSQVLEVKLTCSPNAMEPQTHHSNFL